MIRRYQPTMWIHGHVSYPVSERIDRTWVVANSHGRTRTTNTSFAPDYVVGIRASTGNMSGRRRATSPGNMSTRPKRKNEPPRGFRRRRRLSRAGRQVSRTRMIVPAPNVVRSEVRSANPRTKSSRLYSARNGRIGRQRTASGRVQFPAYSRVSAAHSGGRTACPGEARPTVGSDRRERPHGRRVGSWGQPSHRLVTEDSPLAMPCSLIPPQAP